MNNQYYVIYEGCKKRLETKSPLHVVEELHGSIEHFHGVKWCYETGNDAWNALNRAPNGVVLLGIGLRAGYSNKLWTLIRINGL